MPMWAHAVDGRSSRIITQTGSWGGTGPGPGGQWP
jgi:hypothetical protein